MTDWKDRAACADRDVDPEWFFPDKPGLAGNRAKAICRRCPSQINCLTYALTRPVSGIWGGTSETQRVDLRRQRGIPLPSGWSARQQYMSRWHEKYLELIHLGYKQHEIPKRLGIKASSLMRQIHRHGLTASPELNEMVYDEKHTAADCGHSATFVESP